MKKSYVKPQVYFEDFQLSASIAAGCGSGLNRTDANFGSANSCSYDLEGFGNIFLSRSTCETVPPDESLEMACYHNPDDVQRLFSSI